ncbi:EAL domain-containing protein [Neptuniibacter sp. CAU 1671]|uniref:bifunctional diguanylate cyclase/phosphodiesterase n=1 Tax=Neptuniibacter sp. CAU 1671 TaxID=3032593 RepID=UPI0023DC158F|nr:EAL domain-containing protein [Neptuniibacter sp. CAU 1671]MDF2181028.1 EAL domain-containing protein [Neptuniibacter sp. CAU 1671]
MSDTATTKRFLSLKWKVIWYLALVLLSTQIIYAIYAYQQQLQNLEEVQDFSIQRDSATLDGLIQNSFDRLLEVGEVIPLLAMVTNQQPDADDYVRAIREYLPDMMISGALDGAFLYDNRQRLLERQGNLSALSSKLINEVLTTETPQRQLHCGKTCVRSVAMPVLFGGQTTGVLVVSRELRDIVLEFKTQYGRDIGLAMVGDGNKQFELQYLTKRDDNLDVINRLLGEQTVADEGGVFAVQTDTRAYQVVLKRVAGVTQKAYWILLYDRTELHAKVRSDLFNHLMIAGFGLFFAGLVQLLVLRRPLRTLSRIAQLLPLLASSSYREVRLGLNQFRESKFYSDELDLLQDSTGDLTVQLEHLEASLVQRAQNLQQRSEQLKAERDFVTRLMDTAETLILTMSAEGRVVSINRYGRQLFRLADAPLDLSFLQLAHQADGHEKHLQAMKLVLSGQKSKLQLESSLLDGDGHQVHISWLHSKLELSNSEAVILSIGMDITERTQAEQQVSWLANHDVLTKLPNQVMFNASLEQILRLQQPGSPTAQRVGILFCDFDGFKDVNDSLGHPVGDELLQLAAKRIANVVDGKGMLARQGGDEFSVILSSCEDFDQIAVVADAILEAFRHPFSISGYEIFSSLSIGIAVYPDHGTDRINLVKHADVAMFEAKDRGKNQYCFFEGAKSNARYERFSLTNDLRKALERNEFRLVYQPQVDARNGQVIGVEALLRWQHPVHGMIPPDKFIPLAEESGLIVDIGHWVLQEACRRTQDWNQQGMHFQVGVNLAGQQILHASLLESVEQVLNDTGLAPELLDLEVTENFLLRQPEVTLPKLRQLREMGIRLSMDDFGTGYSSLSYLKKLPLNTLKIDKSFINDIGDRGEGETIIKAIIGLAQGLGMECIAEGVETPRQLTYLINHGCYLIQGYYYSKPLSPDELPDYVRQQMRQSLQLKK